MSPGMSVGMSPCMGAGIGAGIGTCVGTGVGPGMGAGMGAGMGTGTGAGIGPGIGPGISTGISPGISTGMGAVTGGMPVVIPGSTLGGVPIAPSMTNDVMFTPGFLRTQIGRRIRVEFLIGTNNITDRSGTLIGVGASYILLRLEDTGEVIMCDIYSIKFVTIYPVRQ